MNTSCWLWNSATGKALWVCVCVWERKRVSRILCNSEDCIPGQVVRGSLRTVPGCHGNILWSSHPFSAFAATEDFRKKWEIIYILSHWYYLPGMLKNKKYSGPDTWQGPNQPSVPRDNPITELILKPLQVLRALQASKLLSLKKTIEILSPLMSFSSLQTTAAQRARVGADHNEFLEMEVIPTVQFRSLSLNRVFLQSQPEH